MSTGKNYQNPLEQESSISLSLCVKLDIKGQCETMTGSGCRSFIGEKANTLLLEIIGYYKRLSYLNF